jgi:hypothetical protein
MGARRGLTAAAGSTTLLSIATRRGKTLLQIAGGVVQVSGEQPARLRDGESWRIEVGRVQGGFAVKSGEARFRRVDVGRRVCFVRFVLARMTSSYGHVGCARSRAREPEEPETSKFQGNGTCTQHEIRSLAPVREEYRGRASVLVRVHCFQIHPPRHLKTCQYP